MAISFNGQKRIRKTFGRIPEVAPMPNLIEVQRASYDHFLQMGVIAEQRVSVRPGRVGNAVRRRRAVHFHDVGEVIAFSGRVPSLRRTSSSPNMR